MHSAVFSLGHLSIITLCNSIKTLLLQEEKWYSVESNFTFVSDTVAYFFIIIAKLIPRGRLEKID